jgi:hypothetical protein
VSGFSLDDATQPDEVIGISTKISGVFEVEP